MVTAMDLTIHTTVLPHDDPDASLAFWRDAIGFEVRNDIGDGTMRWITVGPADQPGTSILLAPQAADPSITDDERRTIAEMMAKGTLRLDRPGHRRSRWHVRARAGPRRRGCPGADRPTVRYPRLCLPRSRRKPDPHPR